MINRKHELERQILNVKPYYEDLGPIPPEFDTRQPSCWIPADVVLEYNSKVIGFVSSVDTLKTKIKCELEKNYCGIEWPEQAWNSDGLCSISLQCRLSHKVKNVFVLSKSWAAKCTAQLKDLLSEIHIKNIDVLQEIWSDIVSKLNSEVSQWDPDEVRVDVNKKDSIVTVVGNGRSVQKFVSELESTKIERAKKIISENISNLKPHQIQLLAVSGFLSSNAAADGLQVQVVNGTEVVFTGLPGEVLSKKLKMYELLQGVATDTLELPEFIVDLLSQQMYVDHIVSCLKAKNIFAIGNWAKRD